MVSTFKLPLTSTSQPLQTLKFTMAAPGPNAARQNAPHPHSVLADPTGKYLLAPDLGADMIRIWSIDATTGMLTNCPSLNVTGGTGPRHAVFWDPSNSSPSQNSSTGWVMYVANELANTVSAFSVAYPSNACISFTKQQELSPFPNNAKAPIGTKVAEVHTHGNILYSSNRADKSFSGNDSIVSWTLSETGNMTLKGFTFFIWNVSAYILGQQCGYSPCGRGSNNVQHCHC